MYNGCRLEALNFGALNVVFNTWVFLGFLLTKSGLNSKSHVATLLFTDQKLKPVVKCTVFWHLRPVPINLKLGIKSRHFATD